MVGNTTNQPADHDGVLNLKQKLGALEIKIELEKNLEKREDLQEEIEVERLKLNQALMTEATKNVTFSGLVVK